MIPDNGSKGASLAEVMPKDWTPEMAAAFQQQFKEMEDLTIDGAKALYPGMLQGPLFSSNLESGNPGARIIQNDGNLMDSLKIYNIGSVEESDNFARAIMECYRFLIGRNGKPHPRILEKIEGIKIMLSLRCSVGGLWTDHYKQIATGVVTSSVTDKGLVPIIPQARSIAPDNEHLNKQKNSNYRNNGKEKNRP